jgi:hypothetical protein
LPVVSLGWRRQAVADQHAAVGDQHRLVQAGEALAVPAGAAAAALERLHAHEQHGARRVGAALLHRIVEQRLPARRVGGAGVAVGQAGADFLAAAGHRRVAGLQLDAGLGRGQLQQQADRSLAVRHQVGRVRARVDAQAQLDGMRLRGQQQCGSQPPTS